MIAEDRRGPHGLHTVGADIMAGVDIRPQAQEAILTPELETQVDLLVQRYEGFNDLLPDHAKRRREDFLFARDFFKRVLTQRNRRSSEVETDRYRDVVKLASSQILVDTYFVFCMDGRVLPPLVFGASYGIAGSIRVPGGILQEFHRGADGKKFLKSDSTYANLLDAAFSKSDNIAQVFDSHIGCAARNTEEEEAGLHPQDAGLFSDVLYKKEMAEATQRFAQDTYKGQKGVLPIQTSFDPHNGFLYMGLETDEALVSAREKAAKHGQEPEYTVHVLRELVRSGIIISTKQLATDLRPIFKRYGNFDMNWKRQYVQTAEFFWTSINEMKDEVKPIIEARLKEIYPHLNNNSEQSAIELNERAMLLLANAFSGYMLNKGPRKDVNLDSEAEHDGGNYGYGDHMEEFIKIYEGGMPPYETSAFVLFSLDEENLPANTKLATSLVRKNRREGRVVDPFGHFKDRESFEKASVPVVVHEIVRETVSERAWDHLSKIDWSDLPLEWEAFSSGQFMDYLAGKGIRNYEVIKNIDNLRKRMAVLYDSRNPLAHRFVRGELLVLPTIIGRNRRNYFVVPFVKLGY